MGTAAKVIVKPSKSPDEIRPFKAHGHAEVHNFSHGAALRGVFEPGWKWSEDVKPIAGTPSCQAPHRGYVLSGRMRIKPDEGPEVEVAAGDFIDIAPGHDAWVVGDEACVVLDFGGIDTYAKPATQDVAAKPKENRPSVP